MENAPKIDKEALLKNAQQELFIKNKEKALQKIKETELNIQKSKEENDKKFQTFLEAGVLDEESLREMQDSFNKMIQGKLDELAKDREKWNSWKEESEVRKWNEEQVFQKKE